MCFCFLFSVTPSTLSGEGRALWDQTPAREMLGTPGTPGTPGSPAPFPPGRGASGAQDPTQRLRTQDKMGSEEQQELRGDRGDPGGVA